VRDLYLTADPAEAAVLLDKAVIACRADDVAEIASLGRTLGRWREEISTITAPEPRTGRPRA
jgi:hypothetical protein